MAKKKNELELRIAALEAQVAMLAAQIAAARSTTWTQPYPYPGTFCGSIDDGGNAKFVLT